MLLKQRIVLLSLLASSIPCCVAKRRRRRKYKAKNTEHLEKVGGKYMTQFYMPGSDELFDSLMKKEVESNYKLEGIDREWEEEQAMINVMLGDRGKRPNGFVHKKVAKPWPISKASFFIGREHFEN